MKECAWMLLMMMMVVVMVIAEEPETRTQKALSIFTVVKVCYISLKIIEEYNFSCTY